MKKASIILLTFFGLATTAYFLGPKPTAPQEFKGKFTFPPLSELDAFIQKRERETKGLKPGNEAKIVWNDSLTKQKTPISFVYIHGFSASGEEGAPGHVQLAEKFGANLYIARLAEHGIDLGDATMQTLTADKLISSAEEALAIGKEIGEEVVIIGTSMGGALTTYLASKHPEIKAIVLYSPCIEIFDKNAALIDNPWGLQLAKAIKKSDFNDITPKNELQKKYWTLHYRLEGVQALQNFLTNTMHEQTFKNIKCPVYMGYYYKDEENQDKVVSVPAMLKMFDQLGSEKKEKIAFPASKHHVIASYVLSEDWENVRNKTAQFLDSILL